MRLWPEEERYSPYAWAVLLFSCAMVSGALLTFAVTHALDGNRSILMVSGGCGLVMFAVTAALIGTILVRYFGKYRDTALAVDAEGVWWVEGATITPVPWPAIAAVDIVDHRSDRDPAPGRSLVFEVYPLEAKQVDRRRFDVLDRWVHTADPPEPWLPKQRLRFRFSPAATTGDLPGTVRRHAPRLWLGQR